MGKEAYYFSHDCNARVDTKIANMLYDYGMCGYGMYWVIVEVLRESESYKLEKNKKTYRALAMQMRMELEEVEKYIKDCIEDYELFTTDGIYFWTNSLLKRMEKYKNISEQRKKSAEARWGKDKEKNKTNANECKTDANAYKTNANECKTDANAMQLDAKEKKRKESKVKENKELIDSYTTNETLRDSIYGFIEMRKVIKKPLTERGLKLILNKLTKLASLETERIEILENSIMNNWQGIFPLKEQDKPREVITPVNPVKKENAVKIDIEEYKKKMIEGLCANG